MGAVDHGRSLRARSDLSPLAPCAHGARSRASPLNTHDDRLVAVQRACRRYIPMQLRHLHPLPSQIRS